MRLKRCCSAVAHGSERLSPNEHTSAEKNKSGKVHFMHVNSGVCVCEWHINGMER